MALVTYGPMVAALSGTIGGLNFCHSSGGDIVRKSRVSCNRQTAAQLAQRAILHGAGEAWQGMTGLERDAYETSARRLNRRDVFGTARPLTGYGLFSEIYLSFYPAWPFTGEGDIPARRSPPADLYVEPWAQNGELPVRVNLQKGGFLYVDIQVSRPISSKARRRWINWRRAFHEINIGGWAYLGTPGNRAPTLEGLIIGERIGVRARVAEDWTTGFILFSQPVETSVEVVA